MARKLIVALAVVLGAAGLLTEDDAFAQSRSEFPLQIQANLMGGALQYGGDRLAGDYVNDIGVNRWRTGISVGFHVNKFLYVGYSTSPSLDLSVSRSFSFSNGAVDADLNLDRTSNRIEAFEARFSPFKLGLYFSAAYMRIGAASYNMTVERFETDLAIGENLYNTDLQASWDLEESEKIGLGLGYTLIFRSQFSLTLGATVPVSVPEYSNISVLASNESVELSQSDIDFIQRRLEKERLLQPILLSFNLGYNFW